ncbi:MAG: aminotransferase class I/II-fold pyridoxal phosphate-dependent enzyme [Oscillospiraceae bacterium]|nr:aminotransferase class I/II-fold pyridoxal phosphate-dependent enzyme [Oscillospiraceae bacterium]
MRIHGGDVTEKKVIYDFSANLNPLGMPEQVIAAASAAVSECTRYPDHECRKLRKKLSVYENIPYENIVCGNGAADLIFRIVHAFRPEKAVLCIPSFSEYRYALEEVDCQITEYITEASDDFTVNEGILDFLTDDVDIIFLCTPNNPTGKLILPDLLRKISEKCLEKNIILICDECFMPFTGASDEYSLRSCLNENCIVLKAFTKLFAMPGLRLGYALCGSAETAARIHNSGQFWSVSVPAEEAGAAALDVKDWKEKTVAFITKEREYLTEKLCECGLEVTGSSANFLLFRSRDDLGKLLLEKGIMIRECTDFCGLGNGYFRTAVRTRKENEILVEGIKEVLS